MSGISTVQVGIAVPVSLAAETVVLTTTNTSGNSLNSSLSNAPGVGKPSKNRIYGTLNITAGTGTTAVVIRVRQNSITGAIVGGAPGAENDTLAAGNTGSISFDVSDTSAGYGQVYVITAQQTGGTANGSVNYGDATVQDYN